MDSEENIPVEKCECEVVDDTNCKTFFNINRMTKTVCVDPFFNLNKQINECCCDSVHYNK